MPESAVTLIEESALVTPEQQRKAGVFVCASQTDRAVMRTLLQMLGIMPSPDPVQPSKRR
jgi:hypothetical protein